MWENDNEEGTKWIKIDSNIIFTTDPKTIAKDFFNIFVEPYYKKESVCLDLRKFNKIESVVFVNTIKELSNNSDNVVFVYKR